MRAISYHIHKRWFSKLARTSAVTTGVLSGGCLPTASSLAWSGCRQRLARSPIIHTYSTTTGLLSTSSSITSSSFVPKTSLEQDMTIHAVDIMKHSIRAVDPSQAVQSHFQWDAQSSILQLGKTDALDLSKYDELILVAFGKASAAMATAVLQQLEGQSKDDIIANFRKTSGVVICKDDHASDEEIQFLAKYGVEVQMASHPVPDQRSSDAAALLLEIVQRNASPKTLVVCGISGGGSALFCRPTEPLTLNDLQEVNAVLLGSGMGIQDMNVIRKRLEDGKGGRLAAACHPSQVVTLVLSDVLGDPLDLIASGPTVPDTSCWEDAWDIVQQYQIQDQLPDKVVALLQQGVQGDLPDAPPEDHPVFATSKTVLVGNNALAVEAAAERAQALGYQPVVLGTHMEGEAKEMAHMYVGMARHLQETLSAGEKDATMNSLKAFGVAATLPIALIAGGETTVSLPPESSGKGGRNQELALAAAALLEKSDLRNIVLSSVGTDGTDGPTDAAGAVVDGTTLHQTPDALEEGRKALNEHNAYPFLKSLGSAQSNGGNIPAPLIITGPTGTNVADICVTLVGPRHS